MILASLSTRNRLDSERARLLNCLREVNEDRDKSDMLESKLNEECVPISDTIPP